MLIPQRIAIIATLLGASSVFAQHPLISGILVGDSILAGHSPLDGGYGLWRAEVDLYSRDVPGPVRYGPLQTCGRDGCFKASLHDDHIWTFAPGATTYQIIPLEDLQYFEHNDFVRKLREIRFGKEKAKNFKFEYTQMVEWILIADRDYWDNALPYYLGDPVGHDGRRVDMSVKGPWFVRNHHFDILPVEDTKILVFNLNIDRIVVTPVHRKAEARNSFQVEPFKVRNAVRSNNTFEVPFRGDFHVYDSGGAYYFLTDKGQLYRAKSKGDDPKDGWDLSAVWEDKNKPLLGVMHDVKAGKYFAFGTANKKDAATKSDTGERFYFELAAKPVPVDYKRTSKAAKPILEGFNEAYTCAREIALRDKKK